MFHGHLPLSFPLGIPLEGLSCGVCGWFAEYGLSISNAVGGSLRPLAFVWWEMYKSSVLTCRPQNSKLVCRRMFVLLGNSPIPFVDDGTVLVPVAELPYVWGS